jgi:hypothetical protein
MSNRDVAALPQSLSYHMWKLSIHAETAAFARCERNEVPFAARPLSAKLCRVVLRRQKPSDQRIPWKAYLASRQIQDIASDLTGAIFSPSASPAAQSLDHPHYFKTPSFTAPASARARMLMGVTAAAMDGAPLDDARPPAEAEPAVQFARAA